MPELPEVETVRRVLESWCLNKIVKKVYVYYSPIVNNVSSEELNTKLVNQNILGVDRKGKFLIIKLNDYSLVSHLRMEGKWHYGHFKSNNSINEGIVFDPLDKVNKDSKHVHFAIEFSDGHLLMYHDVRKFGRIEIFDKDECYNKEPLTRLGYEPFDSLISSSYLVDKLAKFKGTIKEALLDQSIMCGLGNIYCDEVLFATKLLPSTLAKDIPHNKAEELIKESIRILNKAIELGGSTIKSYHAANSVDGKFQNVLQVYGRDKQHCYSCGSLIYKTKLGGRGTHFCPSCQKSLVKNRVIGVTGFIGSGKSTVCKEFEKNGYFVLDADKITFDAQKKDGFLYSKMLRIFKNYNILDENLELNRGLIRKLIINDASLDKKLKEVVHNYVYNYIFEEIFKNPNKKYVLDVPLLFESHINEICDNIILVECDDELLIERLKNRNTMSIEDALKLKEKQKESLNYKKIDIVINNNSISELNKSINEIIKSFNI